MTTDQLPALNRSAALERMGGDEEIYQEVWEVFSDDVPTQLEELKRLLQANERQTAERIAHSLKSAAGNVGAEQMSRTAAELEKRMSSAPNEDLNGLFDSLKQKFEEVLRLGTC
ncbi:MAG: Hpt domain-containing protein [Bdellovibrionales bacterium]|nr:Hpt domain-containing protein [Bdellovibrionales bacterium]